MQDKVDRPDVAIARIAARQHGVVSSRQVGEVGLSRDGVARRVEVGRLHRVHRGVYAVGHAGLSPHGRWMAAALACGEGAVVSHRSAAELWQLLKPTPGPVHVSVPGYSGRAKRLGIRLHRRASLLPEGTTRRLGIPVTTPAQTIDDLRGVVPERQRRRAIRQAEVLGLMLGGNAQSDRTRSDLERDFLSLCRRGRLPAPAVNVHIGPYLVDFLWRDAKLVVETDGYRYHRGRQAFRDDRRRDLALRARGLDVIRLSEEQINEESARVAGDLREAIASARHRVAGDGGED